MSPRVRFGRALLVHAGGDQSEFVPPVGAMSFDPAVQVVDSDHSSAFSADEEVLAHGDLFDGLFDAKSAGTERIWDDAHARCGDG